MKETLAKGEEAAKKAGDDKDIAEAAKQLKALFDKKTAELETAKKLVTEKATAIDNAKKQVPVAEKLAGVTETDIESALEVVREAEDADLPMGFGRD